MRVELSTFGKFHTFDLARQLYAAGYLQRVYTGYPHFKLRQEGLPKEIISSFPYLVAPLLALRSKGLINGSALKHWDYVNARILGKWIELSKGPSDVFVGLSASGLEAGIKTQKMGGLYVCDRGSGHIRIQDDILREEHRRWGFPYAGIDTRIIDREEREYDIADVITVPSNFASRTFKEAGFDDKKVKTVPYGVDLTRFSPMGTPPKHGFSVAFAGRVTLQKGIPYLLEGFAKLDHAGKSLRIVGPYDRRFVQELYSRRLVPSGVEFLGSVSQAKLSQIFSTSDVLVLPSVQEGFGMVMAQAMACGCPVIASSNTGAENLFVDSSEGFIIPIRSSEKLTDRLSLLAEDRPAASAMRQAALNKVSSLGGWDTYGRAMISILKSRLAQ